MQEPSDRKAPSVTERAREMLPRLPPAQRAIAELLIADPGGVAQLTILDLADRCEVSTGSITRLCRALGLGGYSALRISLAAASGQSESEAWESNIGPDITAEDDLTRVAHVVADAITGTISHTLKTIDFDAVEGAARALADARRVHVCGFGGSGTTGTEFMGRLHRIGIASWAISDVHTAMSGITVLDEGDVVVAISHSGRTRETLALIAQAAARGATVVVVTNDPTAPGARHADIVLDTKVNADGLRSEGILARHAQLAVLDILYIAVVQLTSVQITEALTESEEAIRAYLGKERKGPE